MRKLLLQLDSSRLPSVFDQVVAYDAGADVVMSYGGVAEADVRRGGGRLLLIETSSQESYGSTIRFYERAGYELVARIPGYYRPGDDKLVFAKSLADVG